MNQEPKVGDDVIDSRTKPMAVRGVISSISEAPLKNGHKTVMVDWLPRLIHDPELLHLVPSEWSKVRKAWILSKVPNPDEFCFDPASKRIGRVWGTIDAERQARIIWAADLGQLTAIFEEELARADAVDTDESAKAVTVEFDDMAYSDVGRFWNVLVHKEQ